jgi:hypothetical protein
LKTIARPCSSAAAITSASFTDPPGCTTAWHRPRRTASSPSRNGKNASDAATDPFEDRGVAALPSAGLVDRDLHRIDRLIWPAPIASVRIASVKITVFDLTCAITRQAKRIACHSSAVGWRLVTTLIASVGHGACAFGHAVPLLHEHRAEDRSVVARVGERAEIGDDDTEIGLGREEGPRRLRRRPARSPLQ